MTDLLCIMFSTCWRVLKCWILLLWVLLSNACTPQFTEFVPLQSVCCADVLLLWWMDRLWEYFWVFTVSFLRRIDPEVKFWVMSKTHIYQFPHISTNTSKKKYWSWKKCLCILICNFLMISDVESLFLVPWPIASSLKHVCSRCLPNYGLVC